MPAEFALQFLFRDLTSDADIVGPYFLAGRTMDSRTLFPCVHDTIMLFESYNLRIRALVMDGASYNLSLAQYLCDRTFGAKGSLHEPSAQFPNPLSGDPVFVIICPSHLLKNCINAIFSSKEGGTKQLQIASGNLTWNAIEGMWNRKVDRMQRNQIRRVPGLLKSYIDRDPWTKLNVKPAKIMIQDKVIAELSAYIATCDETGNEVEATENRNVVKYLKALNLLFENGFLSHTPFSSPQAQPCENIKEGFAFFEEWLEFLKATPNFRQTSPLERRFISWQTFSLLKISIIGFLGVVDFMTKQHPAYYVAYLKLNGSAIESLFSKLKYQAGGKLSGLNYGPARDSVVIMERTRPPRNQGSTRQYSYRDEKLDLIDVVDQ